MSLPNPVRRLYVASSKPGDRERLVHASGQPFRVLVVEDDGMVAAVLRDTIEEAGGEVVAMITSGLASVGAAGGTRPDIIVMDVGLPGMDGIDAAAIIRARYPIPVVFISGRDIRDEVARRLGELKAVAFLVKPIDAAALCAALLRAQSQASGV